VTIPDRRRDLGRQQGTHHLRDQIEHTLHDRLSPRHQKADRTAEVRSCRRRTLQPLAEAASLESHQEFLHVDSSDASV